jgi:hypothetical protein
MEKRTPGLNRPIRIQLLAEMDHLLSFLPSGDDALECHDVHARAGLCDRDGREQLDDALGWLGRVHQEVGGAQA